MRKIFFIVIFSAFISSPSLGFAYEVIIPNVPFYISNNNQCGPSSLAMVLNFLGIDITPHEIAKEIYSEGAKGTSDFDMLLYVKKLGLPAQNYRGSVSDLRNKINKGYPLIVMIDEGFWFYKKYHFMVVVGFNNEEVIVNSGQKEREHIKWESFLKKWEKTNFWTLFIKREE